MYSAKQLSIADRQIESAKDELFNEWIKYVDLCEKDGVPHQEWRNWKVGK